MITGVGMDLVEIERIRRLYGRWGAERLDRIFTAAELRYCLAHADPAPSLAARFAAKEAFYKALGTGWGRAGALRDVEVRRDASGDPVLAALGRAAGRLDAHVRIHVTLSHSATVAAAVVILES